MEDKVEQKTLPSQSSKQKNFLNEDSLRDFWDNMKCNNIHIIWIPEEGREQGIENLFEEIMTEKFHNIVKEKDTQVQEAHSKQEGPEKAHTKT